MIFHTDDFYGTKARPTLPLHLVAKKLNFPFNEFLLTRKLAIMRLPELFNLILASGWRFDSICVKKIAKHNKPASKSEKGLEKRSI